MKNKGVLKVISNNKERMMHYIAGDDLLYALSLNDTDLIDELKVNNQIEISFNLKVNELQKAIITIDEEKNKVKALFNKMLEEKNTWFKEFDERLIILEIKVL